MGFWGNDSEQYRASEEVSNAPHKAHLSHELIAGAAAYEAAKAYQEHEKKNGKPENHEKAKDIFAGLVAVAATHIAETKGVDAWDKHKAKVQRDAEEHGSDYLASQY